MKNIKPLDFDTSDPSEEEYERSRTKFINEYKEYKPGYYKKGKYIPGVLWTPGHYQKEWVDGKYVYKPKLGEVEWNEMYPNGYNSWVSKNGNMLTQYGQRRLVEITNQLVKEVNRLSKLSKDNK